MIDFGQRGTVSTAEAALSARPNTGTGWFGPQGSTNWPGGARCERSVKSLVAGSPVTYKRLARLSARIERREGKKMRMRTLMVGGVVLAVTAVLAPAAFAGRQASRVRHPAVTMRLSHTVVSRGQLIYVSTANRSSRWITSDRCPTVSRFVSGRWQRITQTGGVLIACPGIAYFQKPHSRVVFPFKVFADLVSGHYRVSVDCHFGKLQPRGRAFILSSGLDIR